MTKTNNELEEFKKLVVKIGLKAQKEYDFCGEFDRLMVKSLGLGEYFPKRYLLEIQETAKSKWDSVDDWEFSIYQTKKDGISAYNDYVKQRNTPPRKRNTGFNPYYSLDVYKTFYNVDNFDEWVASVRSAVKDRTSTEKTPEPEWVAPAYPKYRLVCINTDEVIVGE